MSIALLGDIHGDARTLLARAKSAAEQGATVLIQVGDFGVYKFSLDALVEAAGASPIPILFIDGNHEDYRMVGAFPTSEPKEIAPKLTYVPRGSVLYVENIRIGFLGGAGSIDYNYRTKDSDWWPDAEQIKDGEVERLLSAGEVDVLVTHTPPRSIIDRFFDTSPIKAQQARRMFGAAPDWTDPSADKVQRAWDALNRPPLFCGHMHRTVLYENVHILNIGEMTFYSADVTE